MSALTFDPDELALCDGCGREHNDIEQCECGICRCPSCREEGCRGCDPHWTDRYWPGA